MHVYVQGTRSLKYFQLLYSVLRQLYGLGPMASMHSTHFPILNSLDRFCTNQPHVGGPTFENVGVL